VKADVLVDDGATTDNYISNIFVDKYLTNYHVIDPLPHRTSTGFKGLSGMSKGQIRIFVLFYDELADARHAWIPLDVTIIDTPYDMIIG